MEESDNQKNKPVKKRLVIDDSNCFDARLSTGEQIEVNKTSILPLVDCHMHIQSLHATPMPLQWAKLYYMLKEQVKIKELADIGHFTFHNDISNTIPVVLYNDLNMFIKGRKLMTMALASVSAVGKIGRLSTDLVAKLYMNDLKNGDMKQKLFWMLYSKAEIADIKARKDELEKSIKEVGEGLELKKMAIERDKLLQNFYKLTSYYYDDYQLFHLSFAMPMDLSFAHFWGSYGLPINLPIPGETGFYYIENLAHIEKKWETSSSYLSLKGEPCNKPEQPLHHLSYCFDFRKELDNYLDYMGHKNNLPGYNRTPEETPFLITFHHNKLDRKIQEVIQDKMSEITPLKDELYYKSLDRDNPPNKEELELLEAEYERKIAQIKAKYDKVLTDYINNIRQKYINTLTNKNFRHFISIIPGDNSEIFEDYYLQLAYTEASSYRYPLQLISFYHYDPRRYYTDRAQLKSMAAKLKERHAFYFLTSNEIHLQDAQPFLTSRVTLSLFELKGMEKDYYLEMFDDRHANRNRDINGIPVKIGSGSMKENSYAIDKLFPNGCFMGVKLYPALGYPPDLYNRNIHAHEGGDYCDDQFSGLKELYRYCQDKKLPLLAHCCPLGMTIGDGFNYEIRDDRKRKKHQWQPRDYHEVKESALYMDDIGGHPKNWEPVLKDFPKLKLCLAHFAGQDVWIDAKKTKEEKGIDDWRADLIALINDYNNVYTDLAYFSLDSQLPQIIPDHIFNNIFRMTNQKLLKKYYVKMSDGCYDYYSLISPPPPEDEIELRITLRMLGGIEDDTSKISRTLVKSLREHSKLKERIMMGTDWYMLEAAKTGTGPYYARLFELLKLVTIKLGGKYDVWHQFSVVNPLNFIGFLKSDDAGVLETNSVDDKTAYVLDERKIEDYINNLRSIPHSRLKYYDVKQHELDNFENNVTYKLEQLKNSTIYTAESMTNSAGKLRILHGKKKVSKYENKKKEPQANDN